MNPQLSQRASLVLLLALGLALACGLLAAGPWPLQADAMALAGTRAWGDLPAAAHVLGSLPLALAGLAGALALRRAGTACPAALQRPCAAFFALAGCSGLLAAALHGGPSGWGFVALHGLMAAGCGMLTLAFLAERVGPGWGSTRACLGVLLAACGAGLCWWLSGGDLRALRWLEALPVLLMGAALLVLPGPRGGDGPWAAMLALCVLSRGLEAADAWVLQVLGFVGGHGLMHLGLACAAALLAHRLGRHAVAAAQPQPCGKPSLRVTSLHTAG